MSTPPYGSNDPFEIPAPRMDVPPPRSGESDAPFISVPPPRTGGNDAPAAPWEPGVPLSPVENPAESTEQPEENGNEPTQLHGIRFAPFNFGQQPTPMTMKAKAQDDGVHLEWKPADTPCVYRVVAQDASEPHSPDLAEEVAVTQGTTAIDTDRPRHAARFYQVWRYEAPTVEEAQTVQPILHATRRITHGIQNPNIRLDEQYVVGKWDSLEGISSVHVYRVPVKVKTTGVAGPEYRVAGTKPNTQGFTDGQGTPGETYIYQFVSVAHDGYSSDPTEITITIPIRLQPVTDLEFELHEPDEQEGRRNPEFDLKWSTPSYGRVEIYRTEKPPVSGLDQETELTASYLNDRGFLTDDERLAMPVHNTGDGTSSMFSVPWPEDWTRAYFTPVVFDRDKVRVGTTIHGQRVRPVTEAKFTERIGRKIISFAWPTGADTVRVYRTHLHGDAQSALSGSPVVQIDESKYRDQGGVSLPGEDDRGGSTYYLVAGLFSGGRDILSKPTALDSTPLVKLQYEVTMTINQANGLDGQLFVKAAESDLREQVTMCVVHNSVRLPLHPADGERVLLTRVAPAGDEPRRSVRPHALYSAYENADSAVYAFTVPHTAGYIRAFLDMRPEDMKRYALLDPPIVRLDPQEWYNYYVPPQVPQQPPQQGYQQAPQQGYQQGYPSQDYPQQGYPQQGYQQGNWQ